MAKANEPRRALSSAELEALIPDLLLIEAWVTAVKGLIEQALRDGEVIDGASLEPKRPTRKWTVEEAALIAHLKKVFLKLGKPATDDAVAPRKVLSPAEAEKVIGKAAFANLLADKAEAKSSGTNLALYPKTRKTETT